MAFPLAQNQDFCLRPTDSYVNQNLYAARNDTNYPTRRPVSEYLSRAGSAPRTLPRSWRSSWVGSRHFPCCDAFPIRSVVREKSSNFNGGRSTPLPLGGKEETPSGTTGFRIAL